MPAPATSGSGATRGTPACGSCAAISGGLSCRPVAVDGGAVLRRGQRPHLPYPLPAVAQTVLAPHAPPAVLALPYPGWLYQELTVDSDADALWSFRQAAASAGHVALAYDYDALKEHQLSLVLNQPGRTISLQGAKTVARKATEAFRDDHEESCAWVGRSQAVPLDLHQLTPVPWEMLRLGPDAPASLHWLWRE